MIFSCCCYAILSVQVLLQEIQMHRAFCYAIQREKEEFKTEFGSIGLSHTNSLDSYQLSSGMCSFAMFA